MYTEIIVELRTNSEKNEAIFVTLVILNIRTKKICRRWKLGQDKLFHNHVEINTNRR